MSYKLVYSDFYSVIRDLLGKDVVRKDGEVTLTGDYPVKGDMISTGFTMLPWREAILLYSDPVLPSQVLLVAPAEPSRFGVDDRLPHRGLGVPATLLASDTDPWMSAASATQWARRWHCGLINLGDAGHINVDAGFGPLPVAKKLTELLMRRVELQQRQAVTA